MREIFIKEIHELEKGKRVKRCPRCQMFAEKNEGVGFVKENIDMNIINQGNVKENSLQEQII